MPCHISSLSIKELVLTSSWRRRRLSSSPPLQPTRSHGSYASARRTLLELQRAADQVFDAVSLKIAEERDKLSDISSRIQVAKAKISEISNSESEVKIVSPAQHPLANTTIDDFKPLFHDKDEGERLGFPVASLSVNGGLNREFGTDGTLELFQFFSEENCGYQLKGSDMKVHTDHV
ncbi:hypothetical protein LUZ61_005970 [Rhynchospora tenuis]|uniref:WASH1 WAHD domain-containing protein n=1 Tax=Rhynchospora tenuis TaxID=198213 RepID=A0AAD6EV79_9POAL|nr:hypothetical protein LUZ61_005970 [Rhynchospora tenuis]